MFSRGAKASHKRKLELAAKKPKRTHKKKHHVIHVRNPELHEYNKGLPKAAAPSAAAAAADAADRAQDDARGTVAARGGRRTRRRRGLLGRLIRNPTRRQLKALLGRRGGGLEEEYKKAFRAAEGSDPSETDLANFLSHGPNTQPEIIKAIQQEAKRKNAGVPEAKAAMEARVYGRQ